MSMLQYVSEVPLPVSDDEMDLNNRTNKRARPVDMSFSDNLVLEEINKKIALKKEEIEVLKKEAKKIGNNKKAMVKARWIYYQEHKEDVMIVGPLREKLRSVGLGGKIPYQLVKKETDKMFASLEKHGVEVYLNLAKQV